MLNHKYEYLIKKYPDINEEFNNIKFGKTKMLYMDNNKIPDKILKNKSPELKLINLKTRPGIESPVNNIDIINKNLTIAQSFRPKNQNNETIQKKIHFPNINSVKNKDSKLYNKFFKKNFSIYNNNPSKWAFHLEMNNINNKNTTNENNKDKDIEKIPIFNKKKIMIKNNNFLSKEKRDNSYNNNTGRNEMMKIDKKSNIQNFKNNYNLKFKNVKMVKNKSSNIFNKIKNATPNSTMFNPFQGMIKFNNNIQNKTLINNKILKNKPFTPSNSNKIEELLSTRLNFLNNISNALGTLSPADCDGVIPIQKIIEIDSQIYKNTYNNFQKSIISKKEDINEADYIKGYAYNSCIGNIRDSNEDVISIEKIYLNNNLNDYCYFFGIFDGHGGKGCANYLKNNLPKNIKEFSTLGVKIAIDITEENFKTNEAIDEKGEIKDSSGSCGIILLIKDKKCIIANIGDSRLVIFKNKNVEFSTMDHKPDSIIEKARIELSNGKIFKTPVAPSSEGKFEIPWKVLPGKLTVSRTFGDIQAKDEKFGGSKTVIIALPDITEINLDDDYNFIILGSDGIFDVLKNEELLECIQIVIKEKKITNFKNDNIHQLCGDFAAMIIKSALAKDSFDNISCIVIAINLDSLLI